MANSTHSIESLKTFLEEGMVQVVCNGLTKDNQSTVIDIMNNVSTMPDVAVQDREAMVGVLLRILGENQRNSQLVNKVLSILDNLLKGQNKEVTGCVVAHKGIEHMQAVLKAHDNNRSLVKKATRVLKQISRQIENVPLLAENKVDLDLICLIDLYNEDDEVKRLALEVLRNICIDKTKGK